MARFCGSCHWGKHCSPWNKRFGMSVAAKAVLLSGLLASFGIAAMLYSKPMWTYWKHINMTLSPMSSDGVPPQQLGILLHPQDHIWRSAQTIELNWNITAGMRSPDGVEKRVYLINGDFPGPTIEARSGDELVVHVHNGLEKEGVSLHWHGLHLLGQNLMDGAVGLTQCPIPAGGDFIYRVRIGDDEHGTFWWHSHEKGQRADGLFGGLVVHRPEGEDEVSSAPYSDEILLMIGDWFHLSADETQEWYLSSVHYGNEPVPDSLLINGKGKFDCSRATPARPLNCTTVPVARGSLLSDRLPATSRWRIINTGSIAGFSLMIPSAQFNVTHVDGGSQVAPVDGNGFGILYPGERVDVIVTAPSDTNASRLFLSIDDENLAYTNPSLQENQSFPVSPHSFLKEDSQPPFPEFPGNHFVDLATLVSRKNNLAPGWPVEAHQTLAVYSKVQILVKYASRTRGYMNHSCWAPQTPPLASLSRQLWNSNQLVPFVASGGSADSPQWVDLVINNLDDGSHPFHFHGHSFYILSTHMSQPGGWGSYNPFESDMPPSGLNMVNPLRKDTVRVPRRGHVVIRFQADNPGIWMLHCHMAVHLGGGLSMAIHVGAPEDEGHVAELSSSAAELCKA